MNRETILELLADRDDYVSGEELAAELNISRAAVWKNIKLLRAEGYEIDSVTNRGYRLCGDGLHKSRIEKYLTRKDCCVEVHRSIGSTNTAAKELAAAGAPAGTVVIAEEQTAGRGRLGRSFYSPRGTGLYLSILLRPDTPAEQSLRITAAAAAAAAKSIEKLSGKKTDIKWVNDILIDGKKVCGILSEAALNCENGKMDYVVVGIGVNLREPEGGFPAELGETAGAVFMADAVPDAGNRLAAELIDSLLDYVDDPKDDDIYSAYVSRSCVIGREVKLVSLTGGSRNAYVTGIDNDYALLVRCEHGSSDRVNTGEISLRLKK